MKYYYGFFRDNNTEKDPEGQLYKVVIKTDKEVSETYVQDELLLSGTPFVVEWDSNDDIYKPYKCSTATVGLQNREFNPDFNAVGMTDVEVYLYKLKEGVTYTDDLIQNDGSAFWDIEWEGYASPNAYSQDYCNYYDEFQLECVDRLSTLKYVDLEYQNDSVTEVQIYWILFLMLVKANIKSCYVSKNIRTPQVVPVGNTSNTAKNTPLDNVLVKKDSFVDNEQEKKKLLEVFGDVLTTLNLTIMQIKDALYIVSYDAIANDYNAYTRYDFALLGLAKYNETIQREYDINKDDSAAHDMNLSLDDVYNKFIIKSSHDFVEVKVVDLDQWYNQTENTFSQATETTNAYVAGWDYFWGGDNDGYVTVGYENSSHSVKEWTSVKFFGINDNAYQDKSMLKIKCYAYAHDSQTELTSPSMYTPGDPINWYRMGCLSFLNNYVICPSQAVLATPMSYVITSNDDYRGAENVRFDQAKTGIMIFHELRGATTADTYIQIANPLSNQDKLKKQPMVDFISEAISIGKNECIVFNCHFNFSIDYLPTSSDVKTGYSLDYINMGVQFKSGSKTYTLNRTTNGDHLIWEETETPIVIRSPLEVWEGKTNAFNNPIIFRSYNNKAKYHLKEYTEGFVIPAPDSNTVLDGTLTITIYRPFGVVSGGTRPKTTSTFIDNISITTTQMNVDETNEISDGENDSEYTLKNQKIVMNDDLEKTLNYISYDGKGNANNYLYLDEGDGHTYLDCLQNVVTGDVLRPEEMLLKAYYRQYGTNAMKLNGSTHGDIDMLTKATYHRFKDKKFIVDGLSVDYAYNKKTFTIVEKK